MPCLCPGENDVPRASVCTRGRECFVQCKPATGEVEAESGNDVAAKVGDVDVVAQARVEHNTVRVRRLLPPVRLLRVQWPHVCGAGQLLQFSVGPDRDSADVGAHVVCDDAVRLVALSHKGNYIHYILIVIILY